ncbi:MAG: DUF4936 family protein [Burkholderiales bacterium]
MSTSYFIHYPVKGEHASAVEARLRGVHSTLLLQLGVKGRLVKNVDDPLLWMEIYDNIVATSAFENLLEQQLADNGIFDLLSREQRKVERFHY